jgi:hypothetical protein
MIVPIPSGENSTTTRPQLIELKTPFAGCAFVVGLVSLSYRVVQGLSSDERARLDTGFLGSCEDMQATHETGQPEPTRTRLR